MAYLSISLSTSWVNEEQIHYFSRSLDLRVTALTLEMRQIQPIYVEDAMFNLYD